VVLLNVWTTWCPPCRKEMPALEALYRRLQGGDFVMLAASQDVDGQSTVLPYLREGGFTFPVLLDVRGEVGKKYGVTGYPETFIPGGWGGPAIACGRYRARAWRQLS